MNCTTVFLYSIMQDVEMFAVFWRSFSKGMHFFINTHKEGCLLLLELTELMILNVGGKHFTS